MWDKVVIDEVGFKIYVDKEYQDDLYLLHQISEYFSNHRGDSITEYDIEYVTSKEIYFIRESIKQEIMNDTCLFNF